MKRSNRLVILVGVLLAVLAFIGIVVLLNNTGEPGPGDEDVTATVVVATEDIPIGTEVTPALLETIEVPLEAVQPEALTDPSQAGGRPAVIAVPAGTQVTEATFAPGGVCISCSLEPGEKAIAFQVDRVTGLDFLVNAGDTVDLVLSQQINVLQETADSAANTDPDAAPRFEVVVGLENARTVKVVLQNKRVLYVSATRAAPSEPVDSDGDGVPDPEQPEQAAIDSVIIVFAGTAADAEVIKFAQRDLGEIGSLTAIVRHTDDEEIAETPGVTLDQLFETYGLRIPAIVTDLQEGAP